jgi:formate dehydrogenase beta subunit
MFAPALVMFGIGLGSAGVLAAAAKAFHVDVDPRIAEVEDRLPGANCGGCGFAGCGACAIAIAMGEAPIDACTAGGPATAILVADVMGGEVGIAEPKSALHSCTGGDRAERIFHYEGALDCRAMEALYGGDLLCSYGCLGLATCVDECAFDALSMNNEGYPEVEASNCTGCGACERVCPTGIIKIKTLSERLLHFAHTAECNAPCEQLCPAQIDIPRYVDLAAQGLYSEAIEVIKERNPLPLICGRVCPAPCEVGCRRASIEDEPVHHNYIKRFIADWEMSLPDRPKASMLPDTGKKVAIVGAGPCGLSAAYYLRRLGHRPTLLDAKPELGGMLRYGIPEYRLPKKVLDFEIQEILDLGIEVRSEVRLGSDVKVEELEDEFDAVLVALGAWDNSALRCEGEDLDGVWKGTEFLQKRELGIDVDLAGQRVVVVGGGNTAMDACRSSLRMGASHVTLLYRRTRNEMPANVEEIVAAEHEGVDYHFLAAPQRLLGDENGQVRQLEYIQMELGEPDASGRRRPVPIEGSETLMDVDVVIAAIGQKPEVDWYTEGLEERGLKLTRWNTIDADEGTLQSGIPHIFTGGDLFSGPALLVDAVGTGRRAARSIHRFFEGESLEHQPGTFNRPTRIEKSYSIGVHSVSALPAVVRPELSVDERITNFEEVDLVVTPELMAAEANRCMRCGTLCFFRDDQKDDHISGRPLLKRIDDLIRISPTN